MMRAAAILILLQAVLLGGLAVSCFDAEPEGVLESAFSETLVRVLGFAAVVAMVALLLLGRRAFLGSKRAVWLGTLLAIALNCVAFAKLRESGLVLVPLVLLSLNFVVLSRVFRTRSLP